MRLPSTTGLDNALNHAFKLGEWHQFVVESSGTQWTLWLDGKHSLSQTMKNADCTKEPANFTAFARLLLDDIRIGELERPTPEDQASCAR
jgi:hypothetical protein